MAFKLQLPTTKEFLFAVEDNGVAGAMQLKRTEDLQGAQLKFTFRQGTVQDDERRSTLAARRKYVLDPETQSLAEISEFSRDHLARLEVYLSLADTDLQLPDGTALEFDTDAGVRRVKNEAQFSHWWGILKASWATEIYKCCLEVNPDWAQFR